MPLLLIIADDFTGALDTGVQFAACGVPTRVVVGDEIDFAKYDADVLVADTETRHLSAEKAYGMVEALTSRALCAGIRYIYKKTDSALRGNIGAELSAVLHASKSRQLPFLPAFPQNGRVTRDGFHYINGMLVTESPFGVDPFEPVQHAKITELLAQQTDLPAKSFPSLRKNEMPPQAEGILVFDAETEQDLIETGQCLFSGEEPTVMAGCAGFAAVLPQLLHLSGSATVLPQLDPRLLVLCGSVNPITLKQLDCAEQAGFTRLRLTPYQKLTVDYWKSISGKNALTEIEKMLMQNDHCIVETNDPGGNQLTAEYAEKLGIDRETLRVRISSSVGQMLGALFTSKALGTLLLTGGDTLLQCMNCIGIHELEPVCELESGVVLARFTYNGCTRHVITKSGGFGQENLLVDLADRIKKNGRKL